MLCCAALCLTCTDALHLCTRSALAHLHLAVAMQRALHLVPGESRAKPFTCKLNETVKIGRKKGDGLPASVSRSACEAQAQSESGTLSLQVTLKSTAYVKRAAVGSKTTVHKDGEVVKVRRLRSKCC